MPLKNININYSIIVEKSSPSPSPIPPRVDMAHIVWTPWRDLSEILEVRRQFYPSLSSKEQDLRRNACSQVSSEVEHLVPDSNNRQVSAWKLRGNLPHAVESTWLLTDAVLADNISVNKLSPLAVRACYATSFCRYVP